LRDYVVSVLMVAIAGVCGWALLPLVRAGSAGLPFVIAILVIAITYGLLPSLLACVLSVLAYDFFFLPPLYSLTIAKSEDAVMLAFFALAAVMVSNLAAYARSQAVIAGDRARQAEALYQFSRQLAAAASLTDVVDGALPYLRATLDAPVLILLPDGDGLTVHPDDPPSGGLDAADRARARLWFQATSAPHPGQDAPAVSGWQFLPMRTGRGVVAVIAIGQACPALRQAVLMGTIADLLAQTIDRINLTTELNQASRASERERLYAALLTSLSHDLRTPLASVLGSADNLVTQGASLDGETRLSLASTIQEEARRLDRYIGNLLDMTRLESGLPGAGSSRIDIADIVGVALQRADRILAGHRLQVAVAADLPLLAGDEVLFEHVLFNLLDNAAKYTPEGSLISLQVVRGPDHVILRLMDEGEGIQPADLPRIFDKFYRARRPDRLRSGTGLGLAISRGYVEAMGGTIEAANRADRSGAVFTIRLPVPAGEALPGPCR
jgi:two-component system sensor histidine kinase KdpD